MTSHESHGMWYTCPTCTIGSFKILSFDLTNN